MAAITFWSALILIIDTGIVTGMNNSDDSMDYSIYEGLDPITDLPRLPNLGIEASSSQTVTNERKRSGSEPSSSQIVANKRNRSGMNPDNLSTKQLEQEFANFKGHYVKVVNLDLSNHNSYNTMCAKSWARKMERGTIRSCSFCIYETHEIERYEVHFKEINASSILVDVFECHCHDISHNTVGTKLVKTLFYIYRHIKADGLMYFIFEKPTNENKLYVNNLYVDFVSNIPFPFKLL